MEKTTVKEKYKNQCVVSKDEFFIKYFTHTVNETFRSQNRCDAWFLLSKEKYGAIMITNIRVYVNKKMYICTLFLTRTEVKKMHFTEILFFINVYIKRYANAR